jgi:hypothetical protein
MCFPGFRKHRSNRRSHPYWLRLRPVRLADCAVRFGRVDVFHNEDRSTTPGRRVDRLELISGNVSIHRASAYQTLDVPSDELWTTPPLRLLGAL